MRYTYNENELTDLIMMHRKEAQKEILEELKEDIDNGFDAYLINNMIKTKLEGLSLDTISETRGKKE